MTQTLRILMIVHGFPPREIAGTEQHVLQLATALKSRGHAVHVLAATRAPGAQQYEIMEEPGITRVVNNLTTRRLADGEKDPIIDRIAARVVGRFRPDVVHIHHIQFLSSSLRFEMPVVLTLHDRWGWCAAGGLGLLPNGTPCAGPQPEACATCASAWRPTPGTLAQGMQRTASLLSPLIPPDTLHAMYRRIPARLRPRPERGAGPPESAADARHRNAEVGALYRSVAARLSPSTHLAAQAEAQGMGPVQVIPHGVPDSLPCTRTGPGGPLVHLGTISAHKGTDRVVAAWREVVPSGDPGLIVHGPILEPEAALGHPVGPILDRRGVAALLSRARALVLAPRWEENAPLIALEARAMGCPVIAPKSGGFPELVEHGVDGLLYDPLDPTALPDAIQSSLEAPLPTPRPPPRLEEQVDSIEAVYLDLAKLKAGECA